MINKFFKKLIKQHNINTTPTLVSGFTLIELMIATSLFTIIMLMGIGSLIVSSNSAKAAQKLRIAVDNVNFAMEIMTRELRTGSLYNCADTSIEISSDIPSDCTGGNVIAFTPQKDEGSSVSRVAYVLKDRVDGATKSLVRCEGDSNNCSEIVSGDVNVQLLKFYVRGSGLNPNNDPDKDKTQPSVSILMSGVVKKKDGFAPFTLQSMASQRSTE